MSEYCSYLQAGSVPATMDRLMVDTILRGNTGVCGGAELKVSASASDLSVNVNPGRCVIPAGVLVNGIPVEGSYLYANTAVKNIPLTTADPTRNRTDLIVVHVYDNVLFGDTGNIGQVELLTGSPSSSSPAPAPTPSFSHYHVVAQVRVNPNASVPSLIVDQRALANPRTQNVYLTQTGGATVDASAASPTWGDWPAQATWNVARPSWATSAQFSLVLNNLLAMTAAPTYTDIRVSCDGAVSVGPQLVFNTAEINERLWPFLVMDAIAAVPGNATNTWKVQARHSGGGLLRYDNSSWARLNVTYIEGLT